MKAFTTDMAELQTRLQALGLNSPIPELQPADPTTKPVDIYRLHLAGLLASALGCEASVAYDAITPSMDVALGDLTVVLPKLRLKDVDLKTLAIDVLTKLPTSPLLPLPYPDGVQLRYFFATQTLPMILLPYIEERKVTYGMDIAQGLRDPAHSEHGRKKVVVEFSSPNIPGEFDGNHLRSTLLGAFVSNMYDSMGWDVVRLNYLGDWGKHTALLIVGWERFGSETALGDDPFGHILDVFTKISALFQPELEASKHAKKENHSTAEIEGMGIFAERDAAFKRMEHGDPDTIELWKKLCDITVGTLTTAYDRLGIKFDEYSGESQAKTETMSEIEAVLERKGVYEESAGSWVIDFDKHGGKGLGTQVIRGRTGSSTYLLRDVAAVLDRDEAHAFDKMIYVVSSRQNNHFKQLFKTLELIDRADLAAKVQHVNFGDIQRLSHYLRRSLQLGNILDECGELMRDSAKANPGEAISDDALAAIGDLAAISGLISQDMFGKRSHGYLFDPKRMTSFEGDSGLKLQTCHWRLVAAIHELHTEDVVAASPDYSCLRDEESVDLLRILAQYPDVTAATFKSLEPHSLLSYLARLADAVADSLSEDEEDEDEAGPSRVQDEDTNEIRRARLVLYESTKYTLEGGMRLLRFPILPS